MLSYYYIFISLFSQFSVINRSKYNVL